MNIKFLSDGSGRQTWRKGDRMRRTKFELRAVTDLQMHVKLKNKLIFFLYYASDRIMYQKVYQLV